MPQPPALCTLCPEPHVTTDWYIVLERGHKNFGEVECAPAHENRIRREVRDGLAPRPRTLVQLVDLCN